MTGEISILAQTDIRVKARNFPLTDALESQVVAKLGRLDKYLDRLRGIDVVLWTESSKEADRHNHVEVTGHAGSRRVHATATAADMYAAVDEVVDKMYRQLNRAKERLKSHHGTRIADAVVPEEAALEPFIEESQDAAIVKVKRFEMKPQFEDEALAEMETLGHSFYVFLNAANERVNVVYRRKDGHYGLIDPLG